jgi:hypothetical protein
MIPPLSTHTQQEHELNANNPLTDHNELTNEHELNAMSHNTKENARPTQEHELHVPPIINKHELNATSNVLREPEPFMHAPEPEPLIPVTDERTVSIQQTISNATDGNMRENDLHLAPPESHPAITQSSQLTQSQLPPTRNQFNILLGTTAFQVA